MMSGRRLLPVVLPLLLAPWLAGCSIPTWMPLIGKDKPKPPAAAAAAVATPRRARRPPRRPGRRSPSGCPTRRP